MLGMVPEMSRRALLAVLMLALAALATGCGDSGDGGGATPTGECLDGTDGEVTIVAEDIAWDADCMTAVADEPLLIRIDNRDDGVNHNLALPDAPGEPGTELEAGPIVQELEVTLPAGEYEYVCDIHPNMVGTLRVAPAGGTDGTGGGPEPG